MSKCILFGEVLVRFSTESFQKITQARNFTIDIVGAETNAGVLLAGLGHESILVSQLPENDLGELALKEIRSTGVDVSHILRSSHRMGTFFLERGFGERSPHILYDRSDSAFCHLNKGDIRWETLFQNSDYFFTTGISFAVSSRAAEVAMDGITTAKRMGINVCMDINHRAKLWTTEEATRVLTPALENVDILIANEEQILAMYDIPDIPPCENDEVNPVRTEVIARWVQQRFGCKKVALSVRRTYSAERMGFGALLLDDRSATWSGWSDFSVLDRIGSGDAFAAALIHGISKGWTSDSVVRFASAACRLKHTISGDWLLADESRILQIAKGATASIQR